MAGPNDRRDAPEYPDFTYRALAVGQLQTALEWNLFTPEVIERIRGMSVRGESGRTHSGNDLLANGRPDIRMGDNIFGVEEAAAAAALLNRTPQQVMSMSPEALFNDLEQYVQNNYGRGNSTHQPSR